MPQSSAERVQTETSSQQGRGRTHKKTESNGSKRSNSHGAASREKEIQQMFRKTPRQRQFDDERAIFDLIRNCPEEDTSALEDYLIRTQNRIDVTALFDENGSTALTLATS